jgi:tetratricopeptide (TPR) repeat protein
LITPRLAAARQALASGDIERAINEARRALDLQTDHAEALGVLAEAFYRKGWYPKALRILRRGTTLATGKSDARLWMLLGIVLDRTGAPPAERLEAYERATKFKPNYAKAWNNLGVIHIKMSQYANAMAALETAVSIDPDSAAAFTNLATAYRRHAFDASTAAATRVEFLRKSERAYRTAIALDEEQVAAYLDLGLLYLDTDSFPGMTPEQRLQAAVRYLREYKQRRTGAAGEGPDVDSYLLAAQWQLDGRLRKTRGKK